MSDTKPIDEKVSSIAHGIFHTLALVCDGPQQAYESLIATFILFHVNCGEHTVDEVVEMFKQDFSNGASATAEAMKRSLQ